MSIKQYSKYQLSVFIIIGVIIFGVLLGAIIRNIGFSNKTNMVELPNQQTGMSNTTSIPNFNYLIDGVIDKIYFDNVWKLDIKVRVYKFINEPPQKEIIKTVIVKNDAKFVLHHLVSNEDVIIEFSDYAPGDDVGIWIEENNQDIFKLDHLTAVKIVKFVE